MTKKVIERTSAGVKIEYEEEKEIPDICMGCPYSVFCYKYLSPEICRELKEEDDKWLPLGYHSKPKETIDVVRVLCGFDHSVDRRIKPTGTYYKYFKIKSVTDMNGYRIVSIRPAKEGEYLNKQKLFKEGKR